MTHFGSHAALGGLVFEPSLLVFSEEDGDNVPLGPASCFQDTARAALTYLS